ncbi:hypothetical protein K227x_06920 [Rubripirellula lacrimiformis]|uniref:Inner membrane protein YdcZ n=1 Tax=Rubripirellula lacrimiformis TaxID=1930273 RepID=A0A517N5A1_9BACT|nr:DMT family transporter [Rubripirellula lacrimiformis]QDT02316.1 hypothetical protein K227x_06920 [Rubripirellula lacrimiformis]
MTAATSGAGILLIAILVGLAAGAVLGVQPSVNGQLGRHVAHPIQASLISFAGGTIALLAICVVCGIFPPRFTVAPSTMPWWAWTGGLFGVVVVSTSLILVPRVGSLPWFAALMTGQVIAAVLLDHFGWLGNAQATASPTRLIGTGLLIAGLMTIVYAKRTEQNVPQRLPSDVVPVAGSLQETGIETDNSVDHAR